jgi:hypothetical protein
VRVLSVACILNCFLLYIELMHINRNNVHEQVSVVFLHEHGFCRTDIDLLFFYLCWLTLVNNSLAMEFLWISWIFLLYFFIVVVIISIGYGDPIEFILCSPEVVSIDVGSIDGDSSDVDVDSDDVGVDSDFFQWKPSFHLLGMILLELM